VQRAIIIGMASPPSIPTAGPDAPGVLWIDLVGPARWRDGHGRRARLSRLDAALLAVLALDGEQPRERLAGWLWPQASRANANLNLRQRIHRLRRDTGRRVIDAGSALVLADDVQCEVDPAAGGPTDGELLAGFDYGDRETLDAWVQTARQRCLTRQLDALAGESARLEAAGALAAAISTCERLLARGPLHEHGWRRLMRLHFLRGDRAAAIDAFERFERLVREEQGSRPAAETVALLRRIEQPDPADPAEKDAEAADPGSGPVAGTRPHAPRLIGRDAAWQALQRAWQAGRAVVVLGESGIGKTRLIDEALRSRPGAVRVAAQPGDAAMPYALARRLLRAAVERHAPPLLAAQMAELARLGAGGARVPGSPGQQALLWQAVAATLESALRQGLDAVGVDDLHCADRASLDLLRWLLASPSLAALRFVFGARPASGDAGWQPWLDDSSRLAVVALAPWTAADVAELLTRLALPGVDVAQFAPRLHRHTGGHPYFTLETLHQMQQEDRVDGPLPEPATITALIARRLAALSPPARELLALLTLVGGALDPAMASDALGAPCDPTADAWRELEAGSWVTGPLPAYDLIRQTVLQSLPPGAQLRLHRRAAAALAARPGAPAGVVAGLWLAAQAWAEAVPWLRRAAGAARIAGRLTECLALLDQAAEASRHAGDEATAIDIACETLPSLTLQQGSAATLARIERLWTLPCTPAQRARLAVARGETELNLARFDDALHSADTAVALARPASPEQADALALRGRTLALVGQGKAGIAQLTQALALAEGLDDPDRRQSTEAAMAHAQFAMRRFRAARDHQLLALALARDLADPARTAECAANLALMHFVAGDAATAGRYAQEAERGYAAMDAGDGAPGVMNRVILGRVMAHLGRFDLAVAALDAACAAPVGACGATTATLARTARALCRLWLGDLARAAGEDFVPPADTLALACLGWWQVQGRVAAAMGRDPGPAWERADVLLAAQPALAREPVPLMELARRLPADEAIHRLRATERACRREGRLAAARSLALHALARLVEVDRAAAAPLAARLRNELPRGLSAGVYPPEAWSVLARALPADGAADCRARALSWLRDQALPHVPVAARAAFLGRNEVNRALWTGAGLPLPPAAPAGCPPPVTAG
jgi:DNA-binding SARP family transcriptional activator